MTERPPAEMLVRAVSPGDAAAIARIYNYYVTDTIVTFEEEAVTAEEFGRRIAEVVSSSMPFFVAERNGELLGYAYASTWKPRRGYRFSAEVTVYLDPSCPRQGIGSKLYERLLASLKDAGFHSAMGGIALPNDGSVALHEKLGFKKVAHFKESGTKFGQWIDVAYWQLTFQPTQPTC